MQHKVKGSEILDRAHAIRTFTSETWINIGDGEFYQPKTRSTVSVSVLFPQVRQVTNSSQRIIAKRRKPGDPLRWVAKQS